MSRLPDIGKSSDKIPYEHLPDLIAEYDQYLEQAEQHLEIKGKTIKQANMENPTWQSYFDQKRIELRSVVKHFEREVERVHGKLYRKYKENHSRELSDREINQYIKNETAYLRMCAFLIEVDEIYKKFDSVVDTFRGRGSVSYTHLTLPTKA